LDHRARRYGETSERAEAARDASATTLLLHRVLIEDNLAQPDELQRPPGIRDVEDGERRSGTHELAAWLDCGRVPEAVVGGAARAGDDVADAVDDPVLHGVMVAAEQRVDLELLE